MFWNKNKNVSTRSSAAPIRSPLALSLEPRMLFDGAVAATVADAATTTADVSQAQSADDSSQHGTDAVIPPAASSDQRQEVVFIDGKLADKQQLIDGLKPGTEVVVLDSSKDGLQQIADYLEGREGIDAIHIFSHGQQGLITLGDFKLDQAALTDQAATLARIGNVLSEDGDILLYGCNVAEGDKGNTFISKLALATGADIAASTDVTGSSALGGNWVLEARTGTVIEDSPLTDQGMADFSSTLQRLVNGGADGTVGWDSIVSNTTVAGNTTGMTGGQIISVTDHLGSGFDIYSKNDSDAGSINFTMRDLTMGMTGSSHAAFVRVSTYAVTPPGEARIVYTPEWLELRANQGIFDLTSIKVGSGDAVTTNSYSFTLQALDSAFNPTGTAVTLNNVAVNSYGTFSVSANTDFDGIYGVRITVDKGIQIAVDDIEVTNPRMPSAPPVATTSGGTTAFTEGNNITSIDSGITLADSDSTTLASATVSITGNFQSGADVLAFTNDGSSMGNISASYNAVTGVMTLTSAEATATLTQWQAALRSVMYSNSSDAPDTNNRTISFVANDGHSDSAAATKTVSVTAVNDAPQVTATGGTPTFTENGSAVDLFSDVTISTVESDQSITQLSLTVTNVSNGNSERLTVDGTTIALINGNSGTTTTNGVSYSVSVVAGTATVTVSKSGGISTAATQTLIDGMSYRNISENPTSGNRVITLTSVKDNGGTANGGVDTTNLSIEATVTVVAVNDPPVVTLTGTAALWSEGNNVASNPIPVDSGMTVSDPDGPNPTSATVRMLTYYSSQDVLAFSNDGNTMGNIVGNWVPGTGILTLTSADNTATAAEFQAAMRSVTYNNTSETPNTTSRTVQFQLTDGGGLSSSAVTRDITISAVDDSPTITAPVTFPVSEDVVTPINGISFSDVDSTIGIVTLSVGSGTLSATNATGVIVSGTPTALILSGTLANINTFISDSRVTFTTAANATSTVTLTINVDTFSVSDATTTMILQVQAVNDAPVVTVPPSITVTEDVASVITGMSFTDIDAGINTVLATFSVPSGTLSATTALGVTVAGSGTGELTLSGSLSDINFFVSANGVTFKTAQDATASVILTVKVNDKGFSGSGGEQIDTKTVTLNVTAVNDAPVNNLPAAQTASQNLDHAFNTANGNAISISDVDSGNGLMTVTLTATNGALSLGSLNGINMVSNNGVTMIFEGNRTNINAALQTLVFRPTNNYLGAATLTIETNDNGNSGTGGAKSDVDVLSITVVPVNPKVTNVSAQGLDRTVKVGDEVLVNMVWDQVVNVDLSSGIPSLLLETGLVDRNAVYVSGTGTNTLVFKYTVQAGDITADLDFQSTAALQMNGAVISNNTSDLAVLTLPTVGGTDSLGGRSNIVVDGVAPVVGSVSAPANGTYITGQGLDFTVNFSEAMTVDTTTGVPRIAVTLDTGDTVYAEYVSGSGGSGLVFRMTVLSGHLDTNGVTLGSVIDLHGGAIKDLAGNNAVVALNSVASTSAVNVDGVAPTVVSVVPPMDGSYKAGSVLTFTVNASEAVQIGSLPPRLVLDVGGVTRYATYVSGSGGGALVFQYVVLNGDNAGNGIAVNSLDLRGEQLTDLAGNDIDPTLGNGNLPGVRVDTTVPSPSNIVRVGASPTNSDSASFTVTFNEDVNGVDVNDFNLVFGGSAAGAIASVTRVDGRTYTVLVDSLAGEGSVQLNLNASGTGIADTAGNALSGGLPGATYSIERVAPSVTSVAVPNGGTYVAGQNLDFTVQMSEAVLLNTSNGSPRLEVTLDNGQKAYATYLSGTGTSALVFRLSVTTGLQDSDGISVAGNIDLNGATLRDAIGNDAQTALNGLHPTDQILVDAVVPVVSSVALPATGAYNAGDVLTFTVNASENVNVDTSNGTPRLALNIGGVTRYASYVSGSGSGALVFQYTIQAGNNASAGIGLPGSIDLNGSTLRDNAGNDMNLQLNTAGTAVGIVVDTVAPQVSDIVRVDITPTNASSLRYTVTFDESVTGVDTADFTLALSGSASGRIASVTRIDGRTYQVLVDNLSGAGNVRLDLNASNTGIADAAGNPITGGLDGSTYGIDRVAPRPSSIVVDGPVLPTDRSLSFTLTFDEAVSGVDLNDFSVLGTSSASGVVQSVQRIDAQTYRIVVGDLRGQGTLSLSLNAPSSGIQDGAGNLLVQSLVSAAQSQQTQDVGDLEYRTNPPDTSMAPQPSVIQPQVPGIVINESISPLAPGSLFEVRTVGGDLRPLGTIFLGNGSNAPSFIAQVFGSSDAGLGSDGQGFLGFGGGDGGVFGSSNFASIFGHDVPGVSEMNVFSGSQWKQSDLNQGLRGVFGVPTFGQQLHELHEGEQRQLRELAQALGQFEGTPTQA